MGLRCSWAGTVWRSSPAKRGAQLQAALVARPGSCIRRLAGGHRARQVQFSRFLYNEAVTVAEMASTAAARTAGLVAGRDVLAIQDSSELAFGGEAPCDCAPSRRPGQAAPPSTHQPPEQHAAAVHLFPRRAPPVPIGKATSTRSLPGDQLAFICSRGSRRTAGSRRRQTRTPRCLPFPTTCLNRLASSLRSRQRQAASRAVRNSPFAMLVSRCVSRRMARHRICR